MANYELPNYKLRECLFTRQDSVARSRWNNGLQSSATETASPIWRGKFSTAPLSEERRAEWHAWLGKLRGGLDTFTAYDKTKPYPRAYPGVTASTGVSAGWNGTATVSSLGASGALGLASLPAEYQVKAGDPVGLEEGGRYGYYIASADVTANGSGVVTISVRPYLHTGLFTTSAVARLFRPLCAFTLDADSFGDGGSSWLAPSPVSFMGTQIL